MFHIYLYLLLFSRTTIFLLSWNYNKIQVAYVKSLTCEISFNQASYAQHSFPVNLSSTKTIVIKTTTTNLPHHLILHPLSQRCLTKIPKLNTKKKIWGFLTCISKILRCLNSRVDYIPDPYLKLFLSFPEIWRNQNEDQ